MWWEVLVLQDAKMEQYVYERFQFNWLKILNNVTKTGQCVTEKFQFN